MSVNKFVYDNVPIKKISYGRQKGVIEIKLFDLHYNLLYKGKAKLSKKKEVKQLLSELKNKGCDIFPEISWF